MANVNDILPLPLAPSSMEGHVTLKAVVQQEQEQEQVCVCVCVCVCACTIGVAPYIFA